MYRNNRSVHIFHYGVTYRYNTRNFKMKVSIVFPGLMPGHGEVTGGYYENASGMFMLYACLTGVNPVVFTGQGVNSLINAGSKIRYFNYLFYASPELPSQGG